MTTSQWVNTQPDAGAIHALLARLGELVPPASIDDLWIFPTRRIAIGESTVFVIAGLDAEDTDRRRVITARFAVTRDRKGSATVQEKLDEHGTAPEAAVARIVQGVLRRLGEEGEQPPREQAIEGDEERWWALVEELGGRRPEPTAPADAPAAASGPEDEQGEEGPKTAESGDDDVASRDETLPEPPGHAVEGLAMAPDADTSGVASDPVLPGAADADRAG